MEAFDANGVTNCGGSPIVCTPLWMGDTAALLLPFVANGVAIAGVLFRDPVWCRRERR